jgi:hypothetical protein
MMRLHTIACGAAALALLGCGQPGVETTPETEIVEAAATTPAPDLPPVAPDLVAAPNTAFIAIEPTELGVIGAPTVWEALGPLISSDAHADPAGREGSETGAAEHESVQFSVRETGDDAVADIVRSGLLDDSVSAGHVRVEFRREPDGWYPTNAYRRQQCRRGAAAGQWSTELCP